MEESNSINLYIALIHYPIYDKNLNIITTAITNFNIHDISRCAFTYGIKKYYIVEPLKDQQELAQRIIKHWSKGFGATYNPNRQTAFSVIEVKNNLEEVKQELYKEYKFKPLLISTDAREFEGSISYKKMRELINKNHQNPFLILFGTGWGISREVINSCDYILEPIRGVGDYNHLSVRSAVSIILDRLLGER